jgi:hypothetical protein
MFQLGKRSALFFIFLGIFVSSQATLADNIKSLNWLPLLTVSMQKLLPDKNCPQNQVNDLQVNKNSTQVNSNIREINWDLNCTQSKSKKVQSKTVINNQQISLLLKHLLELPEFKLNINAINLTSELIKITFSSHLSISKVASQIFITFKSDLLQGKVSLNLQSKKFIANADVMLEELPRFIQFTKQQSHYLNNKLSIGFQSDLNDWQKGRFSVDWQGSVAKFSDHVDLSIEGQIDFFSKKLILSTFFVNAKQVLAPIAEDKSWKTDYIKLKNSGLVLFNYANMSIKSLPLDLRLGSSHLLTKIARGKSKRMRIDNQKLPSLFMQLAINGRKSELLVDWELAVLNQKLEGKLFLDPKLIKLQLLENTLHIQSLVKSSRNYVDGLDRIHIEKGIIKLDLSAQYQRKNKTLTFKSKLITDDVSGKKDNITFDGISFNSDLHYLVDAQNNISILEDKQQLKVANLFVGLPIQAIQVDAIMAAGKPVIQHFKARLLGGRLDFDDFKLNAPSQTILNVGGISMAEMIKYSAYPEIKSQAIIDGMLPLTLTIDGPKVTDGIIFARPPGGYIKVPENTIIKAMGDGNSDLSFTMQLLSNFQFHTMLGRVGYNSDGESDLNIEIKGISPAISGTQPINFNYSHNENILKLLESLRFNDELVDDIKERF